MHGPTCIFWDNLTPFLLQCPSGMTTSAAGSHDASACVCAASKYDSARLAALWLHPGGFNDSRTTDVRELDPR